MVLTKRQAGQSKNYSFFRPAKSPRLEGKNSKDILGSLNDVDLRLSQSDNLFP